MALSVTTVHYDGKRCKIFEITESAANAAASELVSTWAAAGLTAFQGGAEPQEASICPMASAADEAIAVSLKALSSTGFTFRKMTTGAGATSVKWKITLRIPRGIAG